MAALELEQILNTLRSLPSEAVAQVVNVGVETLVRRSTATQSSLTKSA
ncbi:hypothetical protein [Iningainema tapete]|uniref:Uncharacterized protein n=1 Tax=Iningainema tapete BLCC-T55 TaxID=2748662 RepID=A0A8J6XG59_9CYAN|nr:hypothetical protein [Iningainema tapete]MBD2772510.1 hypothetical protein [Iningainema tapete BLCC-T55]